MEYVGQAPVGSVLKGNVAAVQDPSSRKRKDLVLVDLPRLKCAGILPSEEAAGDFQLGQEIEVLVLDLENDEGLALVSEKQLRVERGWEQAQVWCADGELVPFTAREVTRGGLVGYVGDLEAFVPASRAAVNKLYQLPRLVGKTFDTVVVEAERERGNIICSQVLAEERKKKEAFADLQVGQHYCLKVDGIADFGAFLEIAPGITGLLHASELSWKSGHHKPNDYVKIGDEVNVVLTKVSKNKAAFSMKRIQNAWHEAAYEISPGDTVNGLVVNAKKDLGSFVALAGYNRVVGLLRGKELAKGTQVAVTVHAFDPESEKAKLSIAE